MTYTTIQLRLAHQNDNDDDDNDKRQRDDDDNKCIRERVTTMTVKCDNSLMCQAIPYRYENKTSKSVKREE